MKNPCIGINFPDYCGPSNIPNTLEIVSNNGFDAVELTLDSYPLIIRGSINHKYVEYLKSALEQFPLRYAGHIGSGIDLRCHDGLELQKSVVKSSIEICAILGLSPLTVHFEEASRRMAVEQGFLEGYIEAAEYAGTRGVMLCMENIEVEHHTRVLEMVQNVNLDSFRMTLDLGHLYLSTQYFGLDFKTAVKDCAPYLGHVHLHDNTGDFEETRLTDFQKYKGMSMPHRIAFGKGDIHLPPFWGNAPLKWSLERIFETGFDGIVLCEYGSPYYRPFDREIQQRVRDTVTDILKHSGKTN
jgi:sugar phosphate isomerase/epimerase